MAPQALGVLRMGANSDTRYNQPVLHGAGRTPGSFQPLAQVKPGLPAMALRLREKS